MESDEKEFDKNLKGFNAVLPSPDWPTLVPPLATQERPEILVEFAPSDIRRTSGRPSPGFLKVEGSSTAATSLTDLSDLEPFPADCADLYLPNPNIVRSTLVANNSNSNISSRHHFTEGDPHIEPGSSTHLLEAEGSRLYTIHDPNGQQSLSNQPSSKYIFRNRHPGLITCPPDVFFLHWNWPAIRLGCLVVVVSSMVAMLCVIVGLLVTGRSSTCDPSRAWWQGSVSYEIFPASFQDSNNDGFGDFNGLLQRLDYIESLKVASIRLSSIFSALDYPLEYSHVIDFLNVDPHLGQMKDFLELVKELHSRGLYIMLEINPTMTSDQHPWAAHWFLNKTGEYRYYYVETNQSSEALLDGEIEDGDKENPSRPFGSYCYLNWSHPAVREEMNWVLEFWLKQGVDGFYLKYLENLQVVDHSELYFVMSKWRHLLDTYHQGNDKRKVLMVPLAFAESLKSVKSLYTTEILGLCDLLDVQLHIDINQTEDLEKQLFQVNQLPANPWLNWNLGSSETSRIATRLDDNYLLGAIVFLLTLPGSVSLFYGDEINLKDSVDVLTQKEYTVGQLAPMQWTDAMEANFTGNETLPWLPVHPNFRDHNVNSQSYSLAIIRRLVAMRESSPSFWMNMILDDENEARRPSFILHYVDHSMIALERYYPRKKRFLICANFSEKNVTKDFSEFFYQADVILSTSSKTGTLRLRQIFLEPGEAFVAELIG
ncbi:maltase A2-like [Limulus polyphemus]|uniref:Maltase A2-like n=1 Tax=Limulus polyphemus TaxID=6850 RepID=A0ABM1B3W6_LIMPO|nr:maltase A2-like [Limulus polyphemus]